MRKIIILSLLTLIAIGCSSIGQVEGMSNEVYIERFTMPTDSSNVYLIQWKGHVFLYDRNQMPNVIEIDYIRKQ